MTIIFSVPHRLQPQEGEAAFVLPQRIKSGAKETYTKQFSACKA